MKTLLGLIQLNNNDFIATIHYCIEHELNEEASQLFNVFAHMVTCGLSDEDYGSLNDCCCTYIKDCVEN